MPAKKMAWLIGLLMLAVSCTCNDDNYSDDHAVNVARCLQSLEDGTAYEIDEVLTAKAPWKPGQIVIKFRDGEGGYYLREFKGITKAGYYLVQDYQTGGLWPSYPRYNAKKITSEVKMTEPFAFMNLGDITSKKSWPATTTYTPSVCGAFTNYYAPKINEVFVQVKEQGLYLDGAKHGEWVRYYSNGNLDEKVTYKNGVKHGTERSYSRDSGQQEAFSFYDEGQRIYTVRFNATNKTIQFGLWHNNKRVGIWRTWDAQGRVLEETDYDSPS